MKGLFVKDLKLMMLQKNFSVAHFGDCNRNDDIY